jgi:hypothetical protein
LGDEIMSGDNITITSKKVLFVEGQDEINFFGELLKYIGITDVQIISYGGKDNLRNELKTITKIPNFSKVQLFGIVRDADNNIEDAFKSICQILKNNNYMPPDKPNTFSSGAPKVGIYIMPNNKDDGMLEDLCLKTVKDSPLIECIEELIECANLMYENGEVKEFFEKYDYFKNKEVYRKNFSKSNGKIKNIAKAKAQAYLSIMPVIVSSVGVGATKGYWNLESEELNDLKKFLEYFK